jgi:lipase
MDRTAPGLSGHADDVVRLADELGLDGVVLVGHSMGAFLAPLVAARLGPRVRKGAAARRRRRTGTVHIG